MSLFIDLTEFLTYPLTTGIQRIAGEICRHAPSGALIPLRLCSGAFLAFPQNLLDAIAGYFNDATSEGAEQIKRLGAPENGTSVAINSGDSVLVPEVFYKEERVQFFRKMSDRELETYRFIVYDLLPVTHPEFFPADMPLPVIYGYFQLIRRAAHCAYISSATQNAYYGRLRRVSNRGGIVLPLGSDALGQPVKTPVLGRALKFGVVGTIEPRKNHDLILEAFEPLLAEVRGLKLCFVGKIGWATNTLAAKIQAMAADPDSGLEYLPAASDNIIRNHIQDFRATLYLSAAEGYGLPPVESLWLGTPVIASKNIPSLQTLDPIGIRYVEPLDVLNVRRAVLAFTDDVYSNKKICEACRTSLPTWRSFTSAVLDWCRQS
jgi:glycosyltransferase involved in cell wall biosynthesis